MTIFEYRSSVGRLGLQVHVTAGFGDAGFAGNSTLEISCVQPVRIYPDERYARYIITPWRANLSVTKAEYTIVSVAFSRVRCIKFLFYTGRNSF